MWEIFSAEYLTEGPLALLDHQSSSVVESKHALTAEISSGQAQQIDGVRNGPISAFCDALATIGIEARVLDYTEHAPPRVRMRRRPPTLSARSAVRSTGASASTRTRPAPRCAPFCRP